MAKPKAIVSKRLGEVVEVKERALPRARRGQRAFEAEPHDQDHGKAAEHVRAHGLEKCGVLGHEVRQKGKQIVHGTGRHKHLFVKWSLRAFARPAWRRSRWPLAPPWPAGLGHELDVFIEGLRLGVSLAFGFHEALLRQRRQELVGVLGVAQPDHIRGVDLIQDRDLGVHVGVRGKRIVLQVLDGRFDGRCVGSKAAQCLHADEVGAVREFDRGIVGFDSRQLVGGNVAERSPVGPQAYRRGV